MCACTKNQIHGLPASPHLQQKVIAKGLAWNPHLHVHHFTGADSVLKNWRCPDKSRENQALTAHTSLPIEQRALYALNRLGWCAVGGEQWQALPVHDIVVFRRQCHQKAECDEVF